MDRVRSRAYANSSDIVITKRNRIHCGRDNLAEVGDFKDIDKPEQLAAWAGLAPAVYQSADKLVTGSITKHGSRHIRRILVEVAQVIARTNKSNLKRSFLRVQTNKGHNVAAVALARKVLCILHHPMMNREMYQDEGFKKAKAIDFDSSFKRAGKRDRERHSKEKRKPG